MSDSNYIKFCFVSYGQNHYVGVKKYSKDLVKSYKNAKSKMIRRLLKEYGKYNFTDVSFKTDSGKWSKISWKI